MRLTLLIAAATVAATALQPSAHAAPPPEGLPCRWTAVGEDDTTWTGYLAGGPLVAPGAAVSIRCSVHAGNAAHSGPAVAAASSAPSPGVAVVAQPVTYEAPLDAAQVICTEATVDGTRWYWTGEAWTTDAGAECPETVTMQVPPQEVVDAIDAVLDLLNCTNCCGFLPCIDPPVCEVLVAAAGHDVPGVVEIEDDGDMHLADEPFWDCPPYDEWW